MIKSPLLEACVTCVGPLVLYEIGPHVIRLATPRVRTDEHLLPRSVQLDRVRFVLLWELRGIRAVLFPRKISLLAANRVIFLLSCAN